MKKFLSGLVLLLCLCSSYSKAYNQQYQVGDTGEHTLLAHHSREKLENKKVTLMKGFSKDFSYVDRHNLALWVLYWSDSPMPKAIITRS